MKCLVISVINLSILLDKLAKKHAYIIYDFVIDLWKRWAGYVIIGIFLINVIQ